MTVQSEYEDTANSLTESFGQEYYGYAKAASQLGETNLSLIVAGLISACIFIMVVFIRASYMDVKYIPFK